MEEYSVCLDRIGRLVAGYGGAMAPYIGPYRCERYEPKPPVALAPGCLWEKELWFRSEYAGRAGDAYPVTATAWWYALVSCMPAYEPVAAGEADAYADCLDTIAWNVPLLLRDTDAALAIAPYRCLELEPAPPAELGDVGECVDDRVWQYTGDYADSHEQYDIYEMGYWYGLVNCVPSLVASFHRHAPYPPGRQADSLRRLSGRRYAAGAVQMAKRSRQRLCGASLPGTGAGAAGRLGSPRCATINTEWYRETYVDAGAPDPGVWYGLTSCVPQ